MHLTYDIDYAIRSIIPIIKPESTRITIDYDTNGSGAKLAARDKAVYELSHQFSCPPCNVILTNIRVVAE